MLNFRYYVINFCCSMTNIIIANLRKFYFITLLLYVLLPNHNSNHTALNTYSVNSNQTSLTNHYVPSAVPRNWNLLTSIILTKTLLSRFFYYFHFTDEKVLQKLIHLTMFSSLDSGMDLQHILVAAMFYCLIMKLESHGQARMMSLRRLVL